MTMVSRSLLAQLRCGILPLNVETGRFNNVKDVTTGKWRKLRYDERLCTLCNLQTVENEIHFVCECVMYDTERTLLFSEARKNNELFPQLSNDLKFNYLIQEEYKLLSKFLYDAWQIRKNALYVDT